MNDPIVACLAGRLPAYLRDLEELVNQDSGSDDKDGVDRVNAWLQRRLESLGFTVTRVRHDTY
ncbi:MAG: hypothetical protein QJR03_11495 [Sphaerobacter sp.]|nr:hypothetical protein [Sphaerobacter sp.]